MLAALKDKDIAARSETSRELLGDDEILSLLAKMIKQREESAAVYLQGGRPELADNEKAEIVIIREFMPRQMEEADARPPSPPWWRSSAPPASRTWAR